MPSTRNHGDVGLLERGRAEPGAEDLDETSAAPPAWTANTTHWYVDPASVAPGGGIDQPTQGDASAYVRDGYLVMALGDAPIRLFLGQEADLPIELTRGQLVAKLSADGTTVESGIFAGRVSSAAAVSAVAGLLGDCAAADTVASQLVSMYADSMLSGTNDPTATCDALTSPFRSKRLVRSMRRSRRTRSATRRPCVLRS